MINNTGNAQLRNVELVLSDSKVQGNLSCVPPLSAGPVPFAGVVTCQSTYTFTQDEIEAGDLLLSGHAAAAALGTDATLDSITVAVPNYAELLLTLDNATCIAPTAGPDNFAGEAFGGEGARSSNQHLQQSIHCSSTMLDVRQHWNRLCCREGCCCCCCSTIIIA